MGVAGDLFETLKSLCALLNDEHVDYCLIGGLAVAILAKPRAGRISGLILKWVLPLDPGRDFLYISA